MTQRHREVLDRLESDCETMQIHGGECFATKLLDLAATFYVESAIKNRCFAYLRATDQITKLYETDVESLIQQPSIE